MTMGSIQNLDVQIPHKIIQDWGWFLAFGIALLLLGVVAVVRSVTVTIVSMLFFGWLLVFASGVEIAQAGMVGHWAAAEHHQNGSAFHADPRASGTGFIGSGVPSTDQLRTASTTLTADSVGFLEQLACQFKRVSGWFEGSGCDCLLVGRQHLTRH
jgi:hypothetical protein